MGLVEVPAARSNQQHRELRVLGEAIVLSRVGTHERDRAANRIAQIDLTFHLLASDEKPEGTTATIREVSLFPQREHHHTAMFYMAFRAPSDLASTQV